MAGVQTWLTALDTETRPLVEAIRQAVVEAAPELEEEIKWNAPSFAMAGKDRVTLGLARRGGVRAVLHLGAAKAAAPSSFHDGAGLARWPSSDRGVVVFNSLNDFQTRRSAFVDLVRRWIDAARSA